MFKINLKKRETPKGSIIRDIYMECTEGISNKFYKIQITKEYDLNNALIEYLVIGTYGPIGKSGVKSVKYRGTNQEVAQLIAGELTGQKIRKGYKVIAHKNYGEE